MENKKTCKKQIPSAKINNIIACETEGCPSCCNGTYSPTKAKTESITQNIVALNKFNIIPSPPLTLIS